MFQAATKPNNHDAAMDAECMSDSDTMQLHQAAIGVVLAGGYSRRMGYDKAALSINGELLLQRVVRRLALALPNVLVVGPIELRPLVPTVRVAPDTMTGRGPLGGIVTAFDTVPADLLFAVACDMPFVEPMLVRELIRIATETADVDCVALRTERGVEPLHAVYRRTCLPAMRAQLAANDGALHHLLKHVQVREIVPAQTTVFDPAGRSAFNANTPEEWRQALEFAETESNTSTS